MPQREGDLLPVATSHRAPAGPGPSGGTGEPPLDAAGPPEGRTSRPQLVQLDRGDTTVLLALPDHGAPVVLYWGPSLTRSTNGGGRAVVITTSGAGGGAHVLDVLDAVTVPASDSAVGSPQTASLLPLHCDGWLGRPGLAGSRSGRAWSPRFTDVHHSVESAGDLGWRDGPPGAARVATSMTDTADGLTVSLELELLVDGVVRLRATVVNTGADLYEVQALEPALPVPAVADEILDQAGRHTHERHPQRRPFGVGTWVREARGGRPGHDAALLLCAGAHGFGFRNGRVWGVHVAWSGNHTLAAERTPADSRLLRGGELLLPGEIRLATGESYTSPWLVGSWGDGLDGLAGRLHRTVRRRAQHPTRPRPVLLNTWEAVYFTQDGGRLRDLADLAAAVGVERFVLDDGWFTGRRSDHAGLGDWTVDPDRWPQGLHPLVERVRSHGMEFGLWVEPEMVNLDSDLARTHPDWLMATTRGTGIPSRYQHVLDLAHPDAYEHILAALTRLVTEYDIDYLKWDHNRALVDAGQTPHGEPAVHAHTAALYRMLAELRRRHPRLEIESCAGGGARIDLGIADLTDRFWVSDCIDAHERHRMVRWTEMLLPPELLGTHIGAGVDHSTGRTHSLAFRAGTALWGHLGIEADLTTWPAEELERLRRWVDFHKSARSLLHHGTVVHADPTDPAFSLDGVVAADGSTALYRLSCLDHGLVWPPGAVRLPGLHEHRTYRVELLRPDGTPVTRPVAGYDGLPPWAHHTTTLTGAFLAEVGLRPPALRVDELAILRATAV